jgi:hypothetical protein
MRRIETYQPIDGSGSIGHEFNLTDGYRKIGGQ